MKKIQLREQVFPVVALDLCARLPPEQNELQGARIGNVRRYVHEVLASPPRAYCRREPVPLAQECAREDERDRELKEASSEDPDKAAEDPENHVAGLMEDQVGQVQNGIRDRHTHGRGRELPGPDDEPQDQGAARPSRRVAGTWFIDIEHPRPTRLRNRRLSLGGPGALRQFREHDAAARTLGLSMEPVCAALRTSVNHGCATAFHALCVALGLGVDPGVTVDRGAASLVDGDRAGR
jgi:hypothetical protein